MAELKNCETCGNVFATLSRRICPNCYRQEEIAFKEVYQFLKQRKNRKATISEIVVATEVEEELVIKFLKDNRLRHTEFPNLTYPCKRCQTYISEGDYCLGCVREIKQEWTEKENANEQEDEENKNAVYYAVDQVKVHKKRM